MADFEDEEVPRVKKYERGDKLKDTSVKRKHLDEISNSLQRSFASLADLGSKAARSLDQIGSETRESSRKISKIGNLFRRRARVKRKRSFFFLSTSSVCL